MQDIVNIMNQKLYVISGDVLSSRRIKDKAAFQKKLEKACHSINIAFGSDIYAEFKILKGIDEIEGVLLNISNIYRIISSILEQLHPDSMRFVVALDYVDTSIESRDVSKMDGPAFHKASDIMSTLKKSKLMFDMATCNEITDTLITGEINLILLLKKNWSAKQHTIVREYQKTGNQYKVAKALGVTQQAISKALSSSKWKEIGEIEEKLNHVLQRLSQKLPAAWHKRNSS